MLIKNEIPALTGLRGAAAVYVMLFHYFMHLEFTNPLTTFLAHGYLAVDLFFILSGFVMALSYRGLFESGWSSAGFATFLGRRVARIYPLYVAGTLAAFALVLAGYLELPAQSAPLGVALFLNLCLVQVWGFAPGFVTSLDGPGWSISAEWAAYLAFPALLVPTTFRGPRIAWLSAFACAGVLAMLCICRPALLDHNFQPGRLLDFHDSYLAAPILRCIPEFTLGILAFRLAGTRFGRVIASNQWAASGICFLTLALLATPRTDFFVVMLFALAVVSLASAENLQTRLLASPIAELVGLLSYSIYLTHYLLTGVMSRIYLRAEHAGMHHLATVTALSGIALTFVIAYVAYRTIEVPGRQWLRALFARGPLLGSRAAAP